MKNNTTPSALEMVARTAPEAPTTLNLLNKQMEAALQRRHDGDALLLYLTDVQTGEIEAVMWDQAPPHVKDAARVWALDPMGLIGRYENAGVGTLPPAPMQEAA